MKVEYFPNITLEETEAILHSVKELSGYKLGIFSLANMQLLLSNYIRSKGIRRVEDLISKIKSKPEVCEDLIYWIDVPDSEMFRNTDVWLRLRESILPSLLSNREHLTVWFPSCSSGEEVFSFTILSIEEGFRERISIIASSPSNLRINEAINGIYTGNSIEVSRNNYLKSGGKAELEKYIEKIDTVTVRKKIVRENIEFSGQPTLPERRINPVNMIIFKNRLIYYTPEASTKVLNNLLDSLIPGGYLMLGYKEVIRDMAIKSRVRPIFEEEKIYQLI